MNQLQEEQLEERVLLLFDPKPFTFEFAGRNSAEFGLYATIDDYIGPPKREKRKAIPRRHGTHKVNRTTYDDRYITLYCFWLNKAVDAGFNIRRTENIKLAKNLIRDDLREIAHWLMQDGRLFLDIEPDKHYRAEVFNPPTFETVYSRWSEWAETRGGTFVLPFVCEPFAYGPQVIKPIARGSNPVDYRGTADTPTLIIVRNPNNFAVSNIVITATERVG